MYGYKVVLLVGGAELPQFTFITRKYEEDGRSLHESGGMHNTGQVVKALEEPVALAMANAYAEATMAAHKVKYNEDIVLVVRSLD
jgi:3-hydroxyisobutyrate dehydrogenase-like beta-hydroxyacid dehydrogenase